MKGREKKQFGPDVFERKRLKEAEDEDAKYLQRLDEKMKNAFAKIDRNRPQWEICVGCRHFCKNDAGFYCSNRVLAPFVRAVCGGKSWNPSRETPPHHYACPRRFMHLAYEHGETLPHDQREWLLEIHRNVLARRNFGIRMNES